MSLLVCASTAQELTALFSDTATLPAGIQNDAELQLVPVRLKHRDAFLCVTGVGPVNAALAMGLCFAEARAKNQPIDAVLNAGLAGAFDLRALPLRSLCLVREEIWPEYGLHDGQNVTAGAFGHPLWKRGADGMDDVRDRLPLAGLETLNMANASEKFIECRSLTVAGVSASFPRARALWNAYHADIENMEGFAVAYAGVRHAVPCIEIRCISNKVGPRAKEEKDFPGALEALAGILPALNLI